MLGRKTPSCQHQVQIEPKVVSGTIIQLAHTHEQDKEEVWSI